MLEKDLKRNVKLYPWYRAFSYDFIFIWTISILYLTEVKNLSYSQVILLDSIFMLSAFLLQVPISKLVAKIGRSNSARMAAICGIGFSIIYLFGEGYFLFIIANIFYGISMAIRNICDIEILSLSLKKLQRKKEFSKYEGKAMFWYYIFDAIGAIVGGYLYEYLSPYVPIGCMGVCAIIALILAFMMKDPLDEEDDIAEFENEKNTIKEHQPSYKALFKRPFVIWMTIFCFSFYAIGSVHQTMSKVYLQEINVPAYLFGYIFCGFKLLSALSSKFQFKYELKRGVKSLIIFSMMMIFAYIGGAIIYSINPDAIISIIIMIVLFSSQHISRAIYRITVKNYINSCISKNSLNRTLTIYSMSECLGYSLATLFTSFIMEISGNSYVITNLSLVALFSIPIIISVIFFSRALIKSYISRCTIVRKDLE